MKALLLAVFLVGCALGQARDLILGPAATPATQVYRFAGGLLVIDRRLELSPSEAITARVRRANSRAYGALKEAYAAVSASNAPPELPRLIAEGQTAVRLLGITAQLTGMRQDFPGTDPVSIGGWLIGKAFETGPLIEFYEAELNKLNESLNTMFLEERDPTQAEWDVLWAAIEESQARLKAK